MSNLQWKSSLDNKSCTIKIVILNITWKDCKSRKILCKKKFTFTKKFYLHEIAAVNLSKIFFLKNAKKTYKPNNRDLNRDSVTYLFNIRKSLICIFLRKMMMMMVMMMMTVMKFFCEMVEQRKALSLITSRNHFKRFSQSQISDTPRAEFKHT